MKSKAILYLGLILPLAGQAQEGPTVSVTVRGEATIFGGDLAAAREEALVDAQRNALEQVLGVKIRSQTAVQDFTLADDTILSMISGYVKSSEILSEKQEQDYLVLEVQCEVAQQLTDEEASKLMRNFSCVVGFATEIDGQKVDDERLPNKLSADLVKAGFDVRDASQLASLKGFEEHYPAALEKQDAAAARWIGRQLLSNVVVIGQARLKQSQKKELTTYTGPIGVYSYDCWVVARAIETETGQIIAQHSSGIEGIRGTSDTPQKAVTEALANSEKRLSADLIAQLVAYGGKKSRPITVEVMGIPTLEEFQEVKQFLNNIRFRDTEVADLGFEEGKTSTFRFNYSENVNLIALKLDHLPNLAVIERTESKVVCRYAREP